MINQPLYTNEDDYYNLFYSNDDLQNLNCKMIRTELCNYDR